MNKGFDKASAALLGLGVSTVAFLAYAAYRYGIPRGVLYGTIYALAFMFACACFVLCVSARHWREMFLLAVGSVMVAVYAGEAMLLVFNPSNLDKMHEQAASRMQLPFDSRSKWDYIHDSRASGVHVYPPIVPALLLPSDGVKNDGKRLLPLSGLSKVLTVLGNSGGKYVTYMSDEHGFNNPLGGYDENRDIVVIGDSFVHGAHVEQGSDIAGWLRKRGFRILNLGMSGNGPLLDLATLTEYAKPLKPKKVLWVHFEGNDLKDLEHEQASRFLRQYLTGTFSQSLFFQPRDRVDALLRHYLEEAYVLEASNRWREKWREKFASFLLLRNWRNLLQMPATQMFGIRPEFRQILVRASEMTRSWGGRFYFVYLPDGVRYSDGFRGDSFLRKKEVMQIVSSIEGIRIIDLEKALSALPDPASLYPFRVTAGHLSAEGYRYVAEVLSRDLQ